MEEPLLSVASLHALVYCERLFYFEEVERIRVADAAVFAGRRLHVELEAEGADDVVRRGFESDTLGLCGAVDVLRRRDGKTIPYEHKRGRSAGRPGAREAWQTDRVQVAAYAMLVEESQGVPIDEGRVRYHADAVTVSVAIDAALREEVRHAITRARALAASVERPPVTTNEKLCTRCSLAPVCLPEEARFAQGTTSTPTRFLPQHPRGQTLHVTDHRAQVGRSGHELVVKHREGLPTKFPLKEIGQVVLHGFAQISTQAIRLCVDNEVGVHWMTQTGGLIGSLAPSAAPAQRHLRQFAALSRAEVALDLARRLVMAKVENQLRFVLRSTRGLPRDDETTRALATMRGALKRAAHAEDPASLLGHEGSGAAGYFAALPRMLSTELDPRMRFHGRSRRPPADRINALLSYGYGLLYREVLQATISVGLHPGIGFYHRARSSGHPLVLDVMELFRVPVVDMAIVGAVNRKTFDPGVDFQEIGSSVLLSETGRQKAIEVLERRKNDLWRHSVVGYSLSYARIIELEVRLLEKEWLGEGGLFAKMRVR